MPPTDDGMREQELRKAATCAVCKRGILANGLPLFWRVKIERHGVKMDRVRRQTGMEMLMGGNVAIAQTMGPNEVMTEQIMTPRELTVCESCGMKSVMVAVLALEET